MLRADRALAAVLSAAALAGCAANPAVHPAGAAPNAAAPTAPPPAAVPPAAVPSAAVPSAAPAVAPAPPAGSPPPAGPSAADRVALRPAPQQQAPPALVAGPGHPNVVLILTDDLSSDLLPYMPHVQAMQRSGTSFSNYVVSDSLCCPSRSSILTGRFPHNTGVFGNTGSDGGFSAFHAKGGERVTFATALQRSGYRTAFMGKYLNGYQPAANVNGRARYVPPGWSDWAAAGNGYAEFGYRLNVDGRLVQRGTGAKDYLTDVLAVRGAGVVRAAAAARQPFLAEISTFAPHAPYTPAPRDAASFPGLTAPRDPSFNEANTDPPAWLAGHPLTPGQLAGLDEAFRKRVQAVQAVDRLVGRVQGALASAGLANSTYVMFTSDNGLHLGQHQLTAGKLTAFDSDVRVPLVVTGPGVLAGATVADLTQNVDLAPTIERMAGLTPPPSVDGRSLLPLLRGEPVGAWRTAALVEHHGADFYRQDPDYPAAGSGNPTTYQAIRTASSLWVEYADGEREFYDLTSDPYEQHNVAATLPAVTVDQLHAAVTALQTCRGAAGCLAAGRLTG